MFGRKKTKVLEPTPTPLKSWTPQGGSQMQFPEPGSPMAELSALAGSRDAWSGTRDTDRSAR